MFKTILIGGEPAKRAAIKIGEFDYLCGQPFSVAGFVNPHPSENFILVNSGWEWHDVPVFRTLTEAVASDKKINAVGIYLNAKYVLDWVKEVIKHPKLKYSVVFAEDVPEKDQREVVFLTKKYKINLVGPSSTGIIAPGRGRLGEIGGDWNNLNLCNLDKSGPVGIITKSGTISGELLWVVSQNSPGISTAVQIGGDAFPATDFVWWLEEFSRDSKTKVVVLAGEAGGDLEERAADWFGKQKKKPFKLIAVISGRFLESMPKGQKFGHAGAKQEESGFGKAANKIAALRQAGVEVVEFDKLGEYLHETTS